MNDEVTTAVVSGMAPEQVSAAVSVLRVQPNDRLVVAIEIGMMPAPKAQAYMEKWMDLMKSFVPGGVQLLFIPSVKGKPQAELTVLKYEPPTVFGEK